MRLNLTGQAYQARSLIASAQRQLNLYSEPMPQEQGEPAPVTLYPTPGLRLLATLPYGPVRGIRQTTTGQVYVVAGNGVFRMGTDWSYAIVGYLPSSAATPVSMADNGTQLVLVDGSHYGYTIDLTTGVYSGLTDLTGSFNGADRADYLDTFLLFNVPDTQQFQSTLSQSLEFDPLYFAAKVSHPDLLVTLIVCKREIWLIGQRTAEVWYNTGAADFPFSAMPGTFIDHGCCAKYSVALADNTVFWLSQDRLGLGLVLMGAGYSAKRISTFALENELSTYATITDAVGWAYQLSGHTCYVLTFPTANKTWVYDLSTQRWHEWCYLDGNGIEQRHRGVCSTSAHGLTVVGDWETGALYALDATVFTDNGMPIKRQRSLPHLVNDGKRLMYRQLIADMQTGTASGTVAATAPQVFLDWSDDRGASFGNPIGQSLGAAGAYRNVVQWQRLGMARDRVFRLTWDSPALTVLQGVFLDATPAQS
jgi:hypothetical protein